jgi:hypothetical protein
MTSPYLFYFDDQQRAARQSSRTPAFGLGSNTQAPILKNIHSYDPTDKKGVPTIQLVDVVNHFDWTHTASSYRYEVPYIRMSELTVNFNSIRQQLKYMMALGLGNVSDAFDVAVKAGKDIFGVEGGSTDKEASKELKRSKNTDDARWKKIQDANIGSMFSDTVAPKHLRPYYGLYGVSSTGFEYVLPYFVADGKSVDSTWGDMDSSSHGGAISDIIKSTVGPEGFAKTIVDNLAIQSDVVGTHIERAQIYSTQDGPAHTFGFTLFNTGSVASIIKNWHLQFMLAYQNLPNKLSKVNIDPPVIYEIEIPGQFYSPYAYISSLKISHQGATRTMSVPYYTNYLGEVSELVNSSSSDEAATDSEDVRQRRNGTAPIHNDGFPMRQVTQRQGVAGKHLFQDAKAFRSGIMIIPDAYRIEITVKSMIPESKNLHFHSVLGQNTKSQGLYGITVAGGVESAAADDALQTEAMVAKQRKLYRSLPSIQENIAAGDAAGGFFNIAWNTGKEMLRHGLPDWGAPGGMENITHR